MTWPITTDDVREELRQAQSSQRYDDDDLARFAEAAMQWVESQVGPRRGQQLRAVVRCVRDCEELVLPHAAASVQSVTIDGHPFEDWSFDPDESPRALLGSFFRGRIVVAYTAPTTAGDRAPQDVELAAAIHAAHLLRQSRIGVGGGADAGSPTSAAVLFRVAELLAADREAGGFA